MKKLARFAYHQVKNVAKLVIGRRVSIIPLVSMTLDGDDVDIARSWLDDQSRWLDESTVREYEAAFRAWNGSRHAFAFMGGRAALSACIYSLDLGVGDEVIVPAYTCVVVANAFNFARVTPVYADIELETYGLNVRDVETRITHRTKAILLHHLYGLVCRDYEQILELAKSKGLKVIEDCAHATGATYRGIKVGNRGDVAFYSSERSKVFNTILGGVAITNDDDIAVRFKRYCEAAPKLDECFVRNLLKNISLDYYQFKHPYRWVLGELSEIRLDAPPIISTTSEEVSGIRPLQYGARMPSPVAALGINQLKKVDVYNERRREQAKVWDGWCRLRGYEVPTVLPESVPVFLRYPVLVDPSVKRNPHSIRDELGVEVGVWFVSHLHPARDELVGFKEADYAVERCINLPTIL